MLQRARALTLGAAMAIVTGCNTCPHDKCASPPSIEIVARDAVTSTPIASATVTGTNSGRPVDFAFSCGPDCHSGYAVGPTDVTIRADGYEPATLTVNVAEDTCGRTVAEHRDVGLRRAGVTAPAAIVESLGTTGCGQ